MILYDLLSPFFLTVIYNHQALNSLEFPCNDKDKVTVGQRIAPSPRKQKIHSPYNIFTVKSQNPDANKCHVKQNISLCLFVNLNFEICSGIPNNFGGGKVNHLLHLKDIFTEVHIH